MEKGSGFLGGIFDRIKGQAKQAKESIEKGRGNSPILSLESRVPAEKLNQLIDAMCERFVQNQLPSLQQKKVLELGEGSLSFQKVLANKDPKLLCGLLVGDSKQRAAPNPSSVLLQGSFRSIPFANQFFDFVLAKLTTPLQGDVVSAVKEIGRVLSPGGVAFIFDFHPYGLFAKTGTDRLRSIQSTVRGLEDYYKMCRLAQLGIHDVGEGFFDDTIRNMFKTSEELNMFRDLKGTPLILFLKGSKENKIG